MEHSRSATRWRRAPRPAMWRVPLALLLALVALLSAPLPARAASTINVNTTADENGSGAGCSLREAFKSADDNANFGGCTGSGGGTPFTINVPAGTYTLTVDELRVGDATNTDTTVVGAGAATTIIRQTLTNRRVINVNSLLAANVSVSISGVTLTGGRDPSDNFGGAGIIAGGSGNTLSLSSCIIDGNSNNAGSAPKGGGVEFAGGGVLNINNCVISNNTAGTAASNLCVGGGVDFQLLNLAGAAGQGGLNITNTTFTNNVAGAANSGAGGGLRVSVTTTQTPSAVTITNNTFIGNQANAATNGLGGAIASNGSTPITVRFNRIVGNAATGGVTGVYQATGTTGTIDATQNWWGCNAGPGNAGCDSIGGVTASITTAPRLVLTHTASPGTIVTGQATTLTASFGTDSAGAAVSTASLSRLVGLPISFGSAALGTLSGAQASIQANGTATAAFTANAAGAGSAGATVDNGSAAANITINQASTTTTITADTPDPSLAGQGVTVQYSVAVNAPGAGTPTGNVTVSDGVDSCVGTVAAGQCSITLTTSGSRTLTAAYAGDASFSGSTSAGEAHTVNLATQPPQITTQPIDQTLCGDGTATFSAAASGSPTPTVQWQVSDDSGATWSDLSGETNATLSVVASAADNGKQYRAVFTNTAGSATTNAATLTVNTAPAVSTQPSDQTVNAGQSVSFGAAAGGSPTPSVQWQVSTDNGATWSDLSGETATTLTFTAQSGDNGKQFRAVFSSGCGTATTNAATLTVVVDSTPPDTTITSAPSNPTDSTTATFTFVGTDVDSGVASFECKLDGGTFGACTSPKSYSGLSLGSHTFQVRAIDGAGNVDPTPASYTWEIRATTAILYNGGQVVSIGSSFAPAAKLSSAASACVSGKAVTFTLEANPLTGAAGSYTLGTATTSGSGQATMSSVSTSGWREGIYTITASFAGSAGCDPSSDSATLTAAAAGNASTGGGWYSLSGSGRVVFGYNVRKVDNKCTSNCAYKGNLLLINSGKWKLKGNLTSYVKLSGGKGAASGTGDLYWWDTTLNGGLGGWALAKSGVSYTINVYDSGKSGKSSTDSFGIRIVYTPVAPQPGALPNSAPQVLKGGDIKVS